MNRLTKRIVLFTSLFIVSLVVCLQPWSFAGKVLVEAFALYVADCFFTYT